MHPAHLIARLAGPVLILIGIGLLVNNAAYRETATQFLSSQPFIYFSGILAMVSGLAILNAHPVWTRDWHSAVTALGWVLTCIGAFRIVAPQFVVFIGAAAHYSILIGAGIIFLSLGTFLTFKGYTA